MKREVEEALAPLDWAFVQSVDPWGAAWLGARFSIGANDVLADPQSAKASLLSVKGMSEALLVVLRGLDEMPPEQEARIDLGSSPVEERDKGWPKRVEAARSALWSIVPGLVDELRNLEHEAAKASRGGRKNHLAYSVASAVAEIYVIGIGEKPRMGRLESGAGTSGLFGRVTEDVFRALGLQVSGAYRPCAAAIKELDKNRVEELIARRKPWNRIARIPLTR